MQPDASVCPRTTGSRRAGRPAAASWLTGVLFAQKDIASLAAFRLLFGALMCVSSVRFLTSGWLERFYGEPAFFFKYWGFSWVPVPPLWALYVIFGALAVLALLIAVGLFYRVSIVSFFLLFTFTQLLDVTNYLNHYYLVVLLSLLMCFLPLHRAYSLDALRSPGLRAPAVPAWALYLLRFQVGVVYVFAGLAKLNSDWLLHAQPLNLWLSARVETAIVGPYFDQLWLAYVMSWGGFLFDTTIVVWLSWRRTRPFAYALVLGFHLMTDVLFNIGMFPYIMMIAATLFFAPDWPRRLLRQRAAPPEQPRRQAPAPRQKIGLAIAAIYCLIQIAVPLRHYAYPGDVLWNEEGMRFAWKVMVREKHGSVTFYVHFPASGKELQVSPRSYLDARQEREMAGQPDLILQLAHQIAGDFRARGHEDVKVRAEALVSLNGRPAHPMIDSRFDLAAARDGLARKDWILPEPAEDPIALHALRGP